MTHTELSLARNPKLRASLVVMWRAAASVHHTAIQTYTGILIRPDGRREQISTAQLPEGKA